MLERGCGGLRFASFARGEAEGVEKSEDEKESAPPDGGVKMIENDGICGRMGEFVQAGAENQGAIDQQRDADEEPDRNGRLRIHSITRK